MSISTPIAGCDACNKSSLSLLLLRPSPVAKDARLAPAGAASVADAGPLVAGLVPLANPSESRYVLRLLRAGFVHVYIPSPPPGMQNWLSYRVSDSGDLYAEANPVFRQQLQPAACQNTSHNVGGMKLLNIPQAHKIDTLWIAYSANLWTDVLKARNAANPQVMRKVGLRACGVNEFKPTEQSLRTHLLECALGSLRVPNPARPSELRIDEPAFPFAGLAGAVSSLADALARAAACHPSTAGHELAVVLPDHVGVTAELNALRLRRNEWAEAEVLKPENAHPLNSDAAVNGLKQVFLSSNALESYDKVSPLCTKARFDSQTWPAGTEWVPLTASDRQHLQRLAEGDNFLDHLFMAPVRTILDRPDLGRAIYPDHEARAAAWAQNQTEQSWAELAPHVDEAARAAWKSAFDQRMQTLHFEPLKRYEQDWLSARDAPCTVGCFSTHFDAKDPNKLWGMCPAGVVYARESESIDQPAPHSSELHETYLKPLDQPIISDKAVALRALVGNQESVFSLIHTQLTGDPGDTGMRDKTYDFLKGVLGLDAAKPALKKFSWLGDAVGGFSAGYLGSVTGSLMHVAAKQAGAGGLSPQVQARLLKLQALWGVQRTMELAAQGALQGSGGAMPVLLHMQVDAQRALEVLRARAGQATGGSRSYIKRQRRQGAKIRMSLLTDTDTLKSVQGDVNAALADPGTGSLKVGPAAKAATAGLGTLALTEDQFLRLYAKESSLATKAIGALRGSLHSGAGAQAKAVSMSMAGRLALGSTLVQGLGLVNGLYALRQARTDQEVRDAWFGIFDSTAGTLGGLLETWAVAREASVRALAGPAVAKADAAVARSLSIRILIVLGNVAGAAGGVVNAMGAWAKAKDAQAQGDIDVSGLFNLSGAAFLGTAGASGALAAGAVAETLLKRGIGGAVMEAIAIRVGAGGVLATVGGVGLTASGIGLVLLGMGMAFQVGAAALTPTPIQRWLSRSYFGKNPSFLDWDGKRDDMFAKGDWAAELKGFQEALAEGGSVPKSEDAKPSVADKARQAVGL